MAHPAHEWTPWLGPALRSLPPLIGWQREFAPEMSYSALTRARTLRPPSENPATMPFSLFRTDLHESHGNRDRETEKPVSGVKVAVLGGGSSDGPEQRKRHTSPHGPQRAPTDIVAQKADRAQRHPPPGQVVEENILAWFDLAHHKSKLRRCGRGRGFRCQNVLV